MILATVNAIYAIAYTNVSGFIAQLVRASYWYREVPGSNPVEYAKHFLSVRFYVHCHVTFDVNKPRKFGHSGSRLRIHSFGSSRNLAERLFDEPKECPRKMKGDEHAPKSNVTEPRAASLSKLVNHQSLQFDTKN